MPTRYAGAEGIDPLWQESQGGVAARSAGSACLIHA